MAERLPSTRQKWRLGCLENPRNRAVLLAIVRLHSPSQKRKTARKRIITAIEDRTLSPVLAETARTATHIYYAEKLIRPEELGILLDQALGGSGEPFRLTFDDGSSLFLTTSEGLLTVTVSK